MQKGDVAQTDMREVIAITDSNEVEPKDIYILVKLLFPQSLIGQNSVSQARIFEPRYLNWTNLQNMSKVYDP